MSNPDMPRKGITARIKLAFASLMIMFMAFAPTVTAMTFDLNGIEVVLSNMTGIILPQFLNLVIASLPIIVVISIAAFIVAFLDRILAMIKF